MKTFSQFRLWLDEIKLSSWLNKYTVTLLVFFIWMMFFDKHNMLVQYQLHQTSSKLKSQILEDKQLLSEAKEELYVLQTHQLQYAREKYLMHKPDEEVFVVIRD